MKYKLVMFDLDGTLAPSKSPMTKDMSYQLRGLVGSVDVGVISGGSYAQFQSQFLQSLDWTYPEQMEDLYLQPCSGAQLYEHRNGMYRQVYNNDLTLREKVAIYNAFITAAPNPTPLQWGEIAEDRGSQITFSMLGQQAPLEEKEKYDPRGNRRDVICSYMRQMLSSEYEVRFGGTTSIDVTRKGIDKAYGIKKLMEHIPNVDLRYPTIELEDVLFVGDRIYPGGNDYPAKELGVKCVSVKGPEETYEVIEELLNGNDF